jgi:uncharacterized protein
MLCSELEAKGDAFFFEAVNQQFVASKCLKSVVMLALDGVYDEVTGELDRLNTEIMIPNRFVAGEVVKYPKMLWAASVNPLRKDWQSELQWSAAHGAVMVKLIPAVHRFAPDSARFDSFYRELIRLKLPLLIHLDEESSFSESGDTQKFTGTWRIQRALDLGVSVVIAHAASRGQSVPEFMVALRSSGLMVLKKFES